LTCLAVLSGAYLCFSSPFPPFFAELSCGYHDFLFFCVSVTIKEFQNAVNEQNQGFWADFSSFSFACGLSSPNNDAPFSQNNLKMLVFPFTP